MERDGEDKERDGAGRRERMRKQEEHIKSMTDVIGKEPSPRGRELVCSGDGQKENVLSARPDVCFK